MSQSDYIKYKRVGTNLKISNTLIQNKLPPILDPEEFVDYKDYSLENKIPTTKITYNKLIPPNKTIIFNMEKATTNLCPSFTICKNTDTRPNRHLLLTSQITPNPKRPLIPKVRVPPLRQSDLCLCTK